MLPPSPAGAASAERWSWAARAAGVLYPLSPENEHTADGDTSKKKTATPDRLQACHLRKTLRRLEELRAEKELFIQKTR